MGGRGKQWGKNIIQHYLTVISGWKKLKVRSLHHGGTLGTPRLSLAKLEGSVRFLACYCVAVMSPYFLAGDDAVTLQWYHFCPSSSLEPPCHLLSYPVVTRESLRTNTFLFLPGPHHWIPMPSSLCLSCPCGSSSASVSISVTTTRTLNQFLSSRGIECHLGQCLQVQAVVLRGGSLGKSATLFILWAVSPSLVRASYLLLMRSPPS